MKELFCILLVLSIISGLIIHVVGKEPLMWAFASGIRCVFYAFMAFMLAGLLLFIFAREFSKTTAAGVVLLLISAAVLIEIMRDEIRIWEELNIEIGQHLPRMRMLAEDVSHFLPGYHRVLNIYYDNEKEVIMVWLYVIDGAEQAKVYAVLRGDNVALRESLHDDIMRTFYSENYSPSKEGIYCEDALIHGKEMDDVSGTLSYKMTFSYGGASFSALAKDMKERYPKEFKKDSQTWFTLTFQAQ